MRIKITKKDGETNIHDCLNIVIIDEDGEAGNLNTDTIKLVEILEDRATLSDELQHKELKKKVDDAIERFVKLMKDAIID